MNQYTINDISAIYHEIKNDANYEFEKLYEKVENEQLKAIFSTLHSQLLSLYEIMNELLPSGEYEEHFWADPSRDLINVIEKIKRLKGKLINTEYEFDLDDYYNEVILTSRKFLSRSGGSKIPPHTDKIDLYYELPIFIYKNDFKIEMKNSTIYSDLKPIGSGSYAEVYKYTDINYGKDFVVKRAKKNLNSKELSRFAQEFEEMKKLNSPYILEAYTYNSSKKEYTMEYMDYSLEQYISKYNSTIKFSDRKRLGIQILSAFDYIHSKKILHRDISHKNVLIKVYDDVNVIKIADFGLVKIPDSGLTALDTDLKGAFNDLALSQEGFKNYRMIHETYALTKLLYFTLTGRTNIRVDKIDDENLKYFVSKGININNDKRFKNVEEMIPCFKKINLE